MQEFCFFLSVCKFVMHKMVCLLFFRHQWFSGVPCACNIYLAWAVKKVTSLLACIVASFVDYRFT